MPDFDIPLPPPLPEPMVPIVKLPKFMKKEGCFVCNEAYVEGKYNLNQHIKELEAEYDFYKARCKQIKHLDDKRELLEWTSKLLHTVEHLKTHRGVIPSKKESTFPVDVSFSRAMLALFTAERDENSLGMGLFGVLS